MSFPTQVWARFAPRRVRRPAGEAARFHHQRRLARYKATLWRRRPTCARWRIGTRSKTRSKRRCVLIKSVCCAMGVTALTANTREPQLAAQAAAQSRAQASITGALVQQYADDLVKNKTAACVQATICCSCRHRSHGIALAVADPRPQERHGVAAVHGKPAGANCEQRQLPGHSAQSHLFAWVF